MMTSMLTTKHEIVLLDKILTAKNSLEDNSRTTHNVGSPTRAARYQQGAAISTPNLTITDEDMAHQFTWETVNKPGSHYLPIQV